LRDLARARARRSTRSLALAAPLALAALLALVPPALAAPEPSPRASLPAIERQVMCVSCKIPLNVAESQQADRERVFIQSLIARGENEAEIKRALVAQYGITVLGLPRARGFDLTVYLVPAAVVIALAAMLAVLLPRWRRQARAQARDEPPAQALSPGDAARLETDLAHFD
jgi:cytochrome c-type biogenesis protein CcmH/NrfF